LDTGTYSLYPILVTPRLLSSDVCARQTPSPGSIPLILGASVSSVCLQVFNWLRRRRTVWIVDHGQRHRAVFNAIWEAGYGFS